jgi:hypothetical protein
VRSSQEEAWRLGITGVPFNALYRAQPVEMFEEALDTVRAGRVPE